METQDHFRLMHGVIVHPGIHWHTSDTIFRSAIIAMALGDEALLDKCVELLQDHKRWPDEFNEDGDAKTYFVEKLNGLLVKYNRWASRQKHRPIIPWRLRYRCQQGMTRDPFTMVFVAWEVMKEGPCPIKIPLKIQRPGFYAWIKYMKTKDPKWKKRYERTSRRGNLLFDKKMYVLHLNCWRAWAADSQIMKEILQAQIPNWNYACRLLIDHPLNYLQIEFMENYRPRTGLQWTSWKWQNPDNGDGSHYWLPETEKYKLDKLELDFLLNVYKINKNGKSII